MPSARAAPANGPSNARTKSSLFMYDLRSRLTSAVADGACPVLIPALEQPASDHLRLNLRRAFENVENACVA